MMEKEIIIIARIEAKKDQIELVESELLNLIEPVRKEEGCIQYDLHQDNERPEVFLFYERWESRELLEGHRNSKHLKDYLAATEGAVEVFTINEMTRLA